MELVARYVYDAWGNHKVYDANGNENTSDSFIGNLNPFRYRGYYFDTETGLYYLQSRYYDPEIGRFISADDTKYLDPESINGLNLFAYCGNNPVMRVDPNGTSWWDDWGKQALGWVLTGVVLAGLAVATVFTFGAAAPITGLAATIVVGAMIGATVGFGASIISQGISNGWDNINSWQVLFDTGMGAVTGAIGGSGIGMAGSMIAGGVLGFGGSIAGDAIAGKEINWGKAVIMGIVGVGLGAWSGAGAGNAKAMSSSINAGKSWGAKTFMNFGVSVADRGATQLARQTAALFFANAVLGYQAQALVKVTAAYLGSYITGSVLGGIWG